MTIDFLIMAVSVVAMLALGLLVLIRNPRLKINQLFAFLAISTISWTIFNYLSVIFTTNDPVTRMVFVTGVLTALAINLFLASFPTDTGASKRVLVKIHIVSSFILIPVIFLPQFISDITETEIVTSHLYPLFVLYILYSVLLVILTLRRQGKAVNSSIHRAQIRFVAWGVIIYAVTAVIANVILPLFVQDWTSSRIGPIFSLVFIGMVAYTIVKHKLFDVRLIIARAMGYILTLGVVVGGYSAIALFVFSRFFNSSNVTNTQVEAYAILALAFGFSLPPLKKFFDKWSNKLFYRDAYDSQELLDGLNKILVSTVDINKLLKNSAEVINQSIKAEFVMFGIKKIEESPQRIIGTSERQFTEEDIEQVRHITPHMRTKSIVVDELEDKDSKLRDLLRKNDIAVLARLTDTPSKNQEGIGYIVLGSKKSGSPYSRQDLQVLDIIADELVIAIQNALRFEEIQNFNVTLQGKVDDATKKLRAANHRLVELDQTKDDFISMASHQLRTPLTSIKGYVSMVMEGDVGKVSKKQAEMLDQAFVSSQRMVYLIADLLNVSRLRTGKFIIEPKETNLAEVIEGEISQLKETAKGRDLELVFNKPTSFPNLMLDETKIRQVIMNFADNAIYYTPSGGHIKVGLEDKGDSIEFTVTDDGIGVPKPEQHHLFNKFYRAGNAKKARPDGTGLGLFMAKKVVVAQGGSIIFKTQEGKGSTFGFAFTKKPLLPEHFKGVVTSAKEPAKS